MGTHFRQTPNNGYPFPTKWPLKIRWVTGLAASAAHPVGTKSEYPPPPPPGIWLTLWSHLQIRPKKLLYWRNRLLKNRVGRLVIFYIFFYPALCPFIHTYPVYKNIKTEKIQAEIETHAWNIEIRPYIFFFKLHYEDFLWFLMTIAQFLTKIVQ